MAVNPNTDNYQLGKGIVYFNQLISGVYQGERDLGNAPAFSFNVALESLEHFSSRGGLKALDKEIISQITPSLTFTLDEVNAKNIALLALADSTPVYQAASSSLEEEHTANNGARIQLDKRGLTSLTLSFDTGTGAFADGLVVTGAGGATGIIMSVAGTTATGTLIVAKTNAALFVDGETITDSDTGAAKVAAGTVGVVSTGIPIVKLTNSGDTVTYVAGVDYTIETIDISPARIYIEPLIANGGTGSIPDGATVEVTYGYSEQTYTVMSAFANTQVIGALRFISDNPAGNNMELNVWSVSLSPTGDLSLIGDDFTTLAFAGKILKDDLNHSSEPYMRITMFE